MFLTLIKLLSKKTLIKLVNFGFCPYEKISFGFYPYKI